MVRVGGNKEKMRKWREWNSLNILIFSPFPSHFLIFSPFPLYFLILSPFSRSPAARLQQVVQPCLLYLVALQSKNWKVATDSLEGLIAYWISIRLWRKVWIWGNRRDRYPRPAESDGFGGGWDGTKKGQDAAEQGDKEVEGNLLSSPPLFSGTTPSSPDLARVVDFPCSWHLTSFGASWPL